MKGKLCLSVEYKYWTVKHMEISTENISQKDEAEAVLAVQGPQLHHIVTVGRILSCKFTGAGPMPEATSNFFVNRFVS